MNCEFYEGNDIYLFSCIFSIEVSMVVWLLRFLGEMINLRKSLGFLDYNCNR